MSHRICIFVWIVVILVHLMSLNHKKVHANIVQKKDGIKYSYLPLRNKILQWCQDVSFCVKMTAHWQEKDHWISSSTINERNYGMNNALQS